MDVLVAVLLAGGLISIGAHLIRRQRETREAEARDGSLDAERETLRGIERIRPGDVVVDQQARHDLIVERVLRLGEGPLSWTECELRDDARRFGLVLHPTDPDHALVGERVDDLEIVGLQPPESIDHRGRIYRLERCGQARVQDSGPPRAPEAGAGDRDLVGEVIDHWLYHQPGEGRLWLRRVGGEMRVFVGSRLARHLLDFIPA